MMAAATPRAADCRMAREAVSLARGIRRGSRARRGADVPVAEPVVLDGKHVLVIWVSGGQNRLYKAPVSLAKGEKPYAYDVRPGLRRA